MLRAAWIAASFLFTAVPAAATTVTVQPDSRGCYGVDGNPACRQTYTSSGNFFTGRSFNILSRGFLLFDLSGVSGTLLSATLEIDEFRVASPQDQGSEDVAAVSLSQQTISELRSNSRDPSVYSSLGAGTDLGFPTSSTAENFQTKVVSLGPLWLAALQGGFGSDFGVGFSLLSTNSDTLADEGLFGASTSKEVRLNLEFEDDAAVIPLPGAMWLLLGGLGALGLAKRRSHQSV